MNLNRAVIAAAILALVCLGNSIPAIAAEEPYIPSIIYPGPYEPEQLFYRNPKGLDWQQWSSASFTKSVICRGTLNSLKLTGVWQGHLKPNGACGTPAEPSYWALGNWINHDLINKRRSAR